MSWCTTEAISPTSCSISTAQAEIHAIFRLQDSGFKAIRECVAQPGHRHYGHSVPHESGPTLYSNIHEVGVQVASPHQEGEILQETHAAMAPA